MNNNFNEKSAGRDAIIEVARTRGISVTNIYPGKVDRMDYAGKTEYLCRQFISKTSSVAYHACEDKNLTKTFLRQTGLSVPESKNFQFTQLDEAINFAQQLGWPVVVKPKSSSKGDHVFPNIDNEQFIRDIWQDLYSHHKEYILEKHFNGIDYRFFATTEKVVAVSKRLPANVTGDGNHTIKELVEIKNQTSNNSVKILLDEAVIRYLRHQKIDENHVPRRDKQIFLRQNANISTGGSSIDVTDSVSDGFKRLAVDAVRSIPGLCYAGVDIISSAIEDKPNNENYVVIELNASASIAMHQFPASGIPRDVASEIVNIMFPETKPKDENHV